MPEWVIVVGRSLFLITLLFLMIKWLGTKQLSQLNIFETISGIVLGGIVAFHTVDPTTNFTHALIAMAIWFLIPNLVEFISLKSKRFRDFTEGKSIVFIQNGKIMEDNLKKEGYSTDELMVKLREKDVFLTSDVEFALLEPSGEMSILKKSEKQPLTASDVGLKLAPKKEPQTVVMDGKMLLEPLANASLNPNWLETELDKMNVSIENVFLGQVDSDGQLTVDLFDDKIAVPEPTEKPMLLATLKKCQADLELFALATENQDTKDLYEKNGRKMQNAIDIITPYLK